MRNKLIIVAVVLVGLASVAYAAYSQTLSVNGSGTASGNWNVAITGITQVAENGVTENSAPSFTGTSATFDDDLGYPGATATYNVTITNNGSIPAKLNTLTDLSALNAAAPAYITFGVSGVAAGTTTLPAGGTNTMTVNVTWYGASSPDTSTGNSKSATINLGYVQNT